jgi:hypothetical protein
MADIQNQISINLLDKEGSDEKAVQVMEPVFSVKQSGFKDTESIFLLKMTLNSPIKRPPDDPRGWLFLNAKAREGIEVNKSAVISIKDTSEPGVLVCTSVKLSECRIIRKKNADGTFQDSVEVELSIS